MRLVLALLWCVFWSPVFAGDFSFKFRQIHVADVVQLIASDVLQVSYSLPPELVSDDSVITVELRALSVGQVRAYLSDVLAARGYVWVQESGVWFARRSDDVEDFVVYRPVYRSAKYLSDIVRNVVGEKSLEARSVGVGGKDFSGGGGVPVQASGITDAPGTVGALVDKAVFDQLAFKCKPDRCARIRRLLDDVDTPISQVVLKAAVYEVSATKGEGSALSLAMRLLSGKVQLATPAAALVPSAQLQIVNGGIDVVLQALDSDSRFRSMSKPFVRVLSGQKARFEVGQRVPVLGAVTTTSVGAPIQSVDYQESGTIFTVTPDVRREVISLDVSQEISAFVQTQTGVNNSPTLDVRKLTSQLTLQPGEVVVLGGLESVQGSDATSGLFGVHLSSQKSEATQDILLIIEAERI